MVIFDIILITINIVLALIIILIYFKIYQNYNYIDQSHEFFIFLESKEKKYIEYYP